MYHPLIKQPFIIYYTVYGKHFARKHKQKNINGKQCDWEAIRGTQNCIYLKFLISKTVRNVINVPSNGSHKVSVEP